MEITTRFTIASEEGLKNFFFLRNNRLSGMYGGDIEEEQLKQYKEKLADHKETVSELNNLTTQMITVFVNDAPAGYALLKQSAAPEELKGQKTLRLDSFYILPQYDGEDVRDALWKKCMNITRTYEAIWMEMLQKDSFLPYMQSCGFTIYKSSQMEPFAKASYILIRRNQS